MTTIRPYSRRVLNQRFRTWLGENRTLCMVALALLVTFWIVLSVLWSFLDGASGLWWLLGVFHTAAAWVVFNGVLLGFLAQDPEAIWHLRGAWGEDNTREELARARKRGAIWGWVDSIPLSHGDIDHLVVTRSGGLVVIDSKWRSSNRDVPAMVRDAGKVKLRAEALTRDLLKSDVRGGRRARVNPLGVRPVVVVWGRLQREVPEGAAPEGIPFVRGRSLVAWLDGLDGESVDKAAGLHLVREIEKRRDELAAAERRKAAL